MYVMGMGSGLLSYLVTDEAALAVFCRLYSVALE